jgi:transposase
MTFYIGLDVHHTTSTYCVRSAQGRTLGIHTLKERWPKLIEALKQLSGKGPLVVAYEASLGYGTLYDELVKFCKRVVVAHPGQLRLIFKAKRKNDRIDAKKIATLLFMDQLPQVHVPNLDIRAWRELIEVRNKTVCKRTVVKNGLRAVLRAYAIAPPARIGLWTSKGMAWLAAITLPTSQATLRRDLLIDELALLEKQVRHITRELDRMAREHPGVTLLQTIPGIGPRTAEAFIAYVDDPQRFANARRIGAYVGLVPCQDRSASVNRLGHITKQGPATLRQLLVEAAWRSVRHDPSLGRMFETITAGRKDRRKIAVVAVAHKLARIMLVMLKTGCTYDPPAPRPLSHAGQVQESNTNTRPANGSSAKEKRAA